MTFVVGLAWLFKMLKYSKILILYLSALPAVFSQCPRSENIYPCTCMETNEGGMVDCWNMYTPEELVDPIAATAGYRMHSIAVMNSSFMYIPHNVFKHTNYKEISLLNTELISLTDTDEAFQGLESTLKEFRVEGTQYCALWSWEHFKNLRKLELVELNSVRLDDLQEDVPYMSKMTAIGIVNAGISFIGDRVFANLPNLEIWDMSKNEVAALKRSMLPRPANKLQFIIFEDNKLPTLPVDFFEDMPSLNFLSLRNNRFVTLSEKIFADVFWRLGTELFFDGNPFRCDCRMSWLFGRKSSHYFKAECQQPDSYKGRKIMDLSAKELHCPRGVGRIFEVQEEC